MPIFSQHKPFDKFKSLFTHSPQSSEQSERMSTNYKRFIMIGSARAGTSYIEAMLDSHSQIRAHGEIFNLMEIMPTDRLSACLDNPANYVDNTVFTPQPSDIRATGYKMLYDQMGRSNIFIYEPFHMINTADDYKNARDEFYNHFIANYDQKKVAEILTAYFNTLLKDKSLIVIHIKRRNLLYSLLSLSLALRSNTFNSTQGSYNPGPIELGYDYCAGYFKNTRDLQCKYDKEFQDHNIVTIHYEDVLQNINTAMEPVYSLFGVKSEKLKSPLKRQNKRKTHELISNYDELKEKFKDTKWRDFFNED